MNILILGGGSREHALADTVSKSPECDNLYIAPGNAGTRQTATNLPIEETDFEGIKKAVKEYQIDLLIPGPEKPLMMGLKDDFRDDEALNEHMVLGPDQAAAWLEGSKAFAKAFMQRNHIPTGQYQVFSADDYEGALSALDGQAPPYVIKADGLAAGKGVAICASLDEAKDTLHSYMVDRKLGEAAEQVVIEEHLSGSEFSVFVLTDGKNWVTLPDAQDYKRVYDHDQGPNTGGMGAISPAEGLSEAYRQKIADHIVQPTLKGLKNEGYQYTGFLYFGLIDVGGEPFVLEYNVRLGDPEAAVVLALLDEDPLPLFSAAAKGRLNATGMDQQPAAAATVVMASQGYPGKYEKGKTIHGLASVTEAMVYHAGTAVQHKEIVTAGGRVLAVTGIAPGKQQALEKAYQAVSKIHFEGAHYRQDIGQINTPKTHE